MSDRRSRWRATFFVAITLIALWAATELLLRRNAAPAPASAPARVGVTAARRSEVPQTLDAIGTVQPTVSATVRAQLSGTIFAIDVHEGQRVRKGQRLALIDPRPYRLAIAQAQGTLARDMAQLSVARTDLGRYRRLLAEKSIAEQQVSTQAGTVQQLEGTVTGDRAALGSAKLNLAYTEIVSPVAGRVGLRHVDLGNYVTASDSGGIFTVTVDDPVDVNFAVPQDRLGDLGARPAAQTQVRALRQSDGAVLATGQLLAIDNQSDASTGTVSAKARFANAAGKLFANQFVNVSATFGTLHNAVVVPVSAIRHGQQGDFLFVVGADRVARIRKIQLGPGIGDAVAILSGVRVGDTVVSTGADMLDDGVKVEPVAGQARP